MIMRIFDFLLDSFLFILHVIVSLPSWFMFGVRYIVANIGSGIVWIFSEMPKIIAPWYRIQKLFYPFSVLSYDAVNLHHTNMKVRAHYQENLVTWLDENVGKYRWRVIIKITKSGIVRYYLCFRHEGDSMGFKLQWIDNEN